MYYVYIIQNNQKQIYYGSTNDLKRRFKEHNSGRSSYTKGSSWQLVYYEAYASETDARTREKQLKLHGQAWAQLKRRVKDSLAKVSAG